MRNASNPSYNHCLREERLRRHWLQREVADRLGTTTNNVSRWELGQTTPNPYFRAKLCELFGKRPQELGLFHTQVIEEAQLIPMPDIPSTSLSVPDQPVSLWHVPYPCNPHFTGRDGLLEQLARHLSPESQDEQTIILQAALTQPQAIKGLGGIGKTQIAVEYAYRAREQGRFTHILWINAASEEALITSFVTLAELLPAFSEKDQKDQTKLVEAIKRWLEQCQYRWLVIFDNADDVSLVQKYFPTTGNGSILLTTRANAVGSFAVSVEVEKMGLVEGTQFLLHRAQRLHAADEERNEATNVVIALDGFPLALDQAGAYIEETGCRFSTYLHLYQDHRKALLARRGTQGTNYPDSVATTWSLSLRKVEQANPAAVELLRVCAFLAPDHIPEDLLQQGAPHWPPLLQQASAHLFTFNQMLEDLLAFSLVKRLAENQMLSMHRLVQVVQMDAMEPQEQCQWAERVVRVVHAVFPRNPKEEVASWPQCFRYLEQAQACDTLIQQHQLLLPEAAELLDRTAIYLREHASYTLAEPLFQRALRIWEQLMGPEHLQVAFSLHNLAVLYDNQGQYEEAKLLHQRALSIREQQLGPEHTLVATSLNSLANIFFYQGKYQEAEPLYQRALSIREQQLGPEHPRIGTLLGNMANMYQGQGKYQEAELLYQRAIHIRERQLGSEHPSLAFSLNGLAILYYKQERYVEAEPLYQRAQRIWEQHLGPEHPLVAHTLTGLADGHRKQGHYTEAESFYQRALRIWEQQLGFEHPDLAHSLTGLAAIYQAQGRYAEAESLYQRALTLRERAFDPHHPDIAEILEELASLREAQGNLQQAASLYQRALVIHEHVFGSEHPKTVEICTNYTNLLQAMGREEEAVRNSSQQSLLGNA